MRADGGLLSVTWKLHLELWRQYRVAADAYSTLCKTQTVQTPAAFCRKRPTSRGYLRFH